MLSRKQIKREGTRTRVYDVPGAGIYVFTGTGVCIVFSAECMHVNGAEGW